jgi:hypothetical protein
VVVSVILILMGMIGSAVSAARASQKKQATQALIAKLDGVIQQHLSSYASRNLSSAATESLAKVELPDNWTDVGGTATSPQAAYAQIRSTVSTLTTGSFGDAECLFMIVMQGGVADCLDCAGLAASAMGDKDSDGAMEFWDAWGEPIRYVRQPTAIANPQVAAVATQGGKIRPLIYSGGPMKPPLGPTVANTGSNVIQGFITNFDAELTK